MSKFLRKTREKWKETRFSKIVSRPFSNKEAALTSDSVSFISQMTSGDDDGGFYSSSSESEDISFGSPTPSLSKASLDISDVTNVLPGHDHMPSLMITPPSPTSSDNRLDSNSCEAEHKGADECSPSTEEGSHPVEPPEASEQPTGLHPVSTKLPVKQDARLAPDHPQNSPEGHINVVIQGNEFKGGNDTNITVVGSLTINEVAKLTLPQLKTELKPANAAYDSYTSSTERRSHCFEGTRVKLLQEINTWITERGGNQAPVYILDGVAGIGKSTVAQTLAEEAAESGILGASFFFSRDEEQRKTARHFFPTIAFQLACFRADFAIQIGEALEAQPDTIQKHLQTQFMVLIRKPLQSLLSRKERSILVVIDALDECEKEDAKILLNLLVTHVRDLPQLKILITARPEWHIRDVLNDHRNHEQYHLHDIEESVVQSDIRLYLDFCFSSERIQKFFPHSYPLWQPSEESMQMLYGICGTLFLIASTATKFVLDNKRSDPGVQLSRLLEGVSPTDFSGSKRTDVMDKFYIQILCSAAPDDLEEDDRWIDRYQVVVGAVLVLQNPLSCPALAALLDVHASYIADTLLHLHSLVAPSGDDMVFRVHHKSFPDFITSEARITRAAANLKNNTSFVPHLCIDTRPRHHDLAKACFRIMHQHLKRNIVNLPPEEWYKDRTRLQKQCDRNVISDELAYASMHWASHVHAAGRLDGEVWGLLKGWAENYILAWIEVMCVLDEIDNIYWILHKALDTMSTNTQGSPEQSRVQELLLDTRQMVQQTRDFLKLSPMHVYWSGITFVPKESALESTYSRVAEALNVMAGIDKKWNPTLAVLGSGQSSPAVVLTVIFSSDGSRLASASKDDTVRLWNGATGAHVASLTGHKDQITSLVFSGDSSRLASGSKDKTIRLWNGKTGSHIATLAIHYSSIMSVVFSSDSSRIASGSKDKTVRLWNGKTGSYITALNGHMKRVTSVAFSPNGCMLASGSCDSTVRLWNGKTSTQVATLTGHSGWVTSVTFSADSSKLASGSQDKTVRVWNPESGSCTAILKGHSSRVMSVLFSPDSSRLVSRSCDHTIQIWNSQTGSHITALDEHHATVTAISFSDDGSRLASGSRDKTIRIWNAQTGACITTLNGHSGSVMSIAFSTGDSKLASGSKDGTVRLWDGNIGADIAARSDGHARTVASLTFSNDGSKLASVASDRTIRLWDSMKGTHISALKGHPDRVTLLAFSADGSRLVMESKEKKPVLLNGKTGSLITTLKLHAKPSDITMVAISADGSRIGIGTQENDDGRVLAGINLFNGKVGSFMKSWQALVPFGRVTSLAISSDGSRLASGYNVAKVHLFDSTAGSRIDSLVGHTDEIKSLAFSPDGSRLASGSDDRTVRLWDGKTGVPYATLRNHPSRIRSIVFSSDGSRLTSLCTSRAVVLWSCQAASYITSWAARPTDLLIPQSFTFISGILRTPSRITPQHPTGEHSSSPSPTPKHQLNTMLMLVERADSHLSGLVIASLKPDNTWDEVPLCWFPPHLLACTLAASDSGSRVAVGCKDGRVLILDLSSVLT